MPWCWGVVQGLTEVSAEFSSTGPSLKVVAGACMGWFDTRCGRHGGSLSWAASAPVIFYFRRILAAVDPWHQPAWQQGDWTDSLSSAWPGDADRHPADPGGRSWRSRASGRATKPLPCADHLDSTIRFSIVCALLAGPGRKALGAGVRGPCPQAEAHRWGRWWAMGQGYWRLIPAFSFVQAR